MISIGLYENAVTLGLAVLTLLMSRVGINVPTIHVPKAEYDYIVVGSGTAGSVIASNLARFSGGSVLLIEAGGLPSWASLHPSISVFQQRAPEDWEYITEPQESVAFAYNGRRLRWPRGKVLGGSSTINGRVHIWPSPQDMRNWAELTQDEKWLFPNFSRYLQKLENVAESDIATPERGREGNIYISEYPCNTSSICQRFLDAAEYNGHQVGDINSEKHYYFMPVQYTQRYGRRWTAVNGYILPTLSEEHSKLEILINAEVLKIVTRNKRATSVELRVAGSGKRYIVSARREIVLSAGAVGSPVLLLRSGVGPREHLEDVGIPVVHDLPVGKSLLDHVAVPLFVHIDGVFSGPRAPDQWLRYLRNETVRGEEGMDLIGAAKRSSGKPGDLFFRVSYTGPIDVKAAQTIYNFSPEGSRILFPVTKNGFLIVVAHYHPKSKGWLRLREGGENGTVLLQPNYLDHDDDVDALVEGIRMTDQMLRSPSLRSIGARLHIPDIPMCWPKSIHPSLRRPSLDSDSYIRCWVRYGMLPYLHSVGTCKMERPNSVDAVTDTNFRVRGIDGLRVVDSSVIPIQVSANIQATIMGVAEVATDALLGRDQRV